MDDYFRGKKITVMGLGLLGRGVGDAEFLASRGAELIVTDLKSEEELAPSLTRLKKFSNISYTLGRHELKDFRNRDFILKAAGVPLDSPYIAEAEKNNIPLEMSASLAARLSRATTIAVTGTRGKSTTTALIYQILEAGLPAGRVHLGGNVRGVSTLALLPRIKKEDILVLELDSWQLQGFGASAMSPHVAVFTNFLSDHMNYYQGNEERYFGDKANIFKFQRKGDYLVAGEDVAKIIQKKFPSLQSTLVVPPPMPRSWKFKLVGEHFKACAALAIEVGRIVGIAPARLKRTVEGFKGMPGRLELIRTFRGIQFYNDTTSTTPDAAIAALRALSKKRKVILIMGGADKGLNMSPLLKEIPRACKAVFLLSGTGTEKIKHAIMVKMKKEFGALRPAVEEAVNMAKKGDVVLFSPGFASFGMFKNEFDRGDQFVRLVKTRT